MSGNIPNTLPAHLESTAATIRTRAKPGLSPKEIEMTALENYAAAYGEKPTATDMSDSDWYGRSPALGVDTDAAVRGATAEAAEAYQEIVYGDSLDSHLGGLRLKRAVLRLAVTLGNETRAMEVLGDATINRGVIAAKFHYHGNAKERYVFDAAALEAGATRELAHPGLAARLADLEARIAATPDR